MRKEIKLVKWESGLISLNLCFKVQQGDTDPGGSDSKTSANNAGDLGSIPGSGRSPGEGNGTPLQYSCLENPMDRGSWSWGSQRVRYDWATSLSLSRRYWTVSSTEITGNGKGCPPSFPALVCFRNDHNWPGIPWNAVGIAEAAGVNMYHCLLSPAPQADHLHLRHTGWYNRPLMV